MRNRSCNLVKVGLLLIIIVFVSCKQHINNIQAEHPQLTDSILSKAALLPEQKRIEYINQGFAKFKPGPEDSWKRYTFIRSIYLRHRDYYKASEYADSMIIVMKPVVKVNKNYRQDLANAYYCKGDVQLALNNFEVAFKLFDKANQLETDRIFNYHMRLAYGFFQQGNFKQSVRYFKLVLYDKPVDNTPWDRFAYTQALQDNIGLCFGSLNKPDSALYYFNQALNYIKNNKTRFTKPDQKIYINIAKAIIYGNKAKVLLTVGQKTEAERLFNLDIELTKNNYGEEDGEISRERLAELYLERHEVYRVLPMLDTIKIWANKPRYINHKQQFLKLSAEVFSQLGYFEKANLANKQLLNLEDSLAKQKNANVQGGLEHIIAYNEKINQVSLLETEGAHTRLLLGGAILILLLLVLIAILLWWNYHRSKINIKQLKLLNEKVNVKNIELGRAFDAIDISYKTNSRIVRLVAHDLRSPIVAMRTFIKLLDNPQLASKEKHNIAQLLHTNCTDALSLIEDMLNNNTTSEHLMLEQIDLGSIIKKCIDQLRIKSTEKLQHIEFLPVLVIINADAEKLYRVFDNLITNAIKFTNVGGTINIKMQFINSEVIVSVADNGIGIPEKIQNKLFDISVDIKRRGTSNEPSHGLGLYICRQIVEAHKGEIWFKPVKGRGSVFNVQLPCYLT